MTAPAGPQPARFLVTGGAGFIGSHLVEALVRAGHRVRVLDDLSTGRRENLAQVADDVDLLLGDIRDTDVCRRACADVDYVLHHAAKVSVAESLEVPLDTHEVNALGTLKLLVAARESGCRRVVYAGSASAYGDSDTSAQSEDLPAHPLSPYAVAKHVGELYCRIFHQLYGLETVVLRYFNVFGPRQDPQSPYSGVIARFIAQLTRGQPITIHGDGEQTRDFVPVENVVSANLLACAAPGAPGQVINIGCGERISINHLAAALIELTDAPSRPSHGPARPSDIRHSCADISRAKRLLGYQVLVTPYEGLRRTVAWYGGQ
jgi:nucleoside-diphosphate-sugar epimerase